MSSATSCAVLPGADHHTFLFLSTRRMTCRMRSAWRCRAKSSRCGYSGILGGWPPGPTGKYKMASCNSHPLTFASNVHKSIFLASSSQVGSGLDGCRQPYIDIILCPRISGSHGQRPLADRKYGSFGGNDRPNGRWPYSFCKLCSFTESYRKLQFWPIWGIALY
jgi:hypothetical protein